MFDIGSPELLLIAVVALLVLGPERLPEAIRAVAKGWGRLSRTVNRALTQIQAEIGFDRIRAQLEEESVVGEIKAMQIELNELAGGAAGGGGGLTELEKPSPSSDPSHWPGMPPADGGS